MIEKIPHSAESPRCSVIIPAYNAADFVVQAVHSALSQRPEAPQVIVVDDGSSDTTAALVEKIDGVTLIRQANAGCPAARLAGLKHATGAFFIFLDADDELLPGAITAHLAAMDAAPQAAMVFGANHRIDATGARIATYPQKPFETADPHVVAFQVTPAPSQCMYRRSAFEAVGGYDPALRLCEDSDLNIRITQAGSIICHGDMVLNYRMHGGQATKRPSKICRAHLGVIRNHLGPDGTFPDATELARSLKKWKQYYGRNIPIEIIRTALRRDLPGSAAALKTFTACLPHSAVGAVGNAPDLLRQRLKRRKSA